jgi:MFS family permease
MAGSAYRELLAKRQIQVVVATSLLIGIATGTPLAVVLLVQHQTGSFAQAGAVTAAFAIASAVSGPAQGRLIDRVGHTRTLPAFSVTGAVFMTVLVVAVLHGAPLGVLIAIAALSAAANPPMFPALRPLWAGLIDRPQQLGTAYAIHAVIVEICFILGPILAAVLVAVWSAAAAVIVITLLKTAGTLAFAATPASRRWRGEQHAGPRHWLGPLASPGMRAMLVADIPFGAFIGLLDVAVPAFAKEEGSTALAGVLLAALAIGSMVGGVVYGSRPRTLSGTRYAQIAALQALLTVPLIFADSPVALGVGMALAGLAVAPLSVVGSGITDVVAPAGTATEATSWVLTAYQVGLAAGTASAGAIVDGPGTQTAFAAAVGCAAFSAAVLWLRRRALDGHGLKTVGTVAPTPAVTAIDQ